MASRCGLPRPAGSPARAQYGERELLRRQARLWVVAAVEVVVVVEPELGAELGAEAEPELVVVVVVAAVHMREEWLLLVLWASARRCTAARPLWRPCRGRTQARSLPPGAASRLQHGSRANRLARVSRAALGPRRSQLS